MCACPPPRTSPAPLALVRVRLEKVDPFPRQWPYGCSTSQEVAGSIPYIVLAQFRLELTKLSCLCLVNPLSNGHLPVPVPPGPRLFQRQGVWLRFSI
jgi:hypothetical protein